MSNDEADDSRELGVEFGELDDELKSHDYPTTTDELVDEYGDYEIEMSNETRTFGDIMEPYQEETGQDFSDAGEVKQAVLNMVGSEAVGRQRYSGRGLDQDPDEQDSV
ncbi:DUF5789 family protein [Haloprofundus salinisoli]|uniref:DUF5789 family protein n=1 Tax=Haloprofundus salinisoli TaxID=2876193 RepID=UPI001CCB0CF5|nr:hypothetical protein [Haloprofundus salinisoli]